MKIIFECSNITNEGGGLSLLKNLLLYYNDKTKVEIILYSSKKTLNKYGNP